MMLFRESRTADPSYPYPVLAMARICQEWFQEDPGRYQEAVDHYELLAKILEENPPADTEKALFQGFYFQGLLYLKGGECEKAPEAFRAFLPAYPDYANPESTHNAIGIAFYYLSQYDRAVEAFRKAVQARPDYPEARFNLRSVYTRLAAYNEATANARAENLDAALQGVTQLKEFAPRFLPGRRLEATILQKLGRTGEALAVLTELLSLDPTHPVTYGVWLDLAKIFEARGRTREALELLQENQRRFPDTPDPEGQKELVRLVESLGGKQ